MILKSYNYFASSGQYTLIPYNKNLVRGIIHTVEALKLLLPQLFGEVCFGESPI